MKFPLLISGVLLAVACGTQDPDSRSSTSKVNTAEATNCRVEKDGWVFELKTGYAIMPATAQVYVENGSFADEVTFHKTGLFGFLLPSLEADIPSLGKVTLNVLSESMVVSVKQNGKSVFSGKADCIPADIRN